MAYKVMVIWPNQEISDIELDFVPVTGNAISIDGRDYYTTEAHESMITEETHPNSWNCDYVILLSKFYR